MEKSRFVQPFVYGESQQQRERKIKHNQSIEKQNNAKGSNYEEILPNKYNSVKQTKVTFVPFTTPYVTVSTTPLYRTYVPITSPSYQPSPESKNQYKIPDLPRPLSSLPQTTSSPKSIFCQKLSLLWSTNKPVFISIIIGIILIIVGIIFGIVIGTQSKKHSQSDFGQINRYGIAHPYYGDQFTKKIHLQNNHQQNSLSNHINSINIKQNQQQLKNHLTYRNYKVLNHQFQ